MKFYVLDPPVISGEVDEADLTKDVIEGAEVSLPCSGAGNPPPARMWKKNDEALKAKHGIFLESDGTVEIENASREHSGVYQCILSNSYGKANLTYYVNIMGQFVSCSYFIQKFIPENLIFFAQIGIEDVWILLMIISNTVCIMRMSHAYEGIYGVFFFL